MKLKKSLVLISTLTLSVLSVPAQPQSGFTWFSVKVVSNSDLSNILNDQPQGGLNVTTTNFEGQVSTVKVNLGNFISNLGINTNTVASFTSDNPPSEFTIPSATSLSSSRVAQQVAPQVATEFATQQPNTAANLQASPQEVETGNGLTGEILGTASGLAETSNPGTSAGGTFNAQDENGNFVAQNVTNEEETVQAQNQVRITTPGTFAQNPNSPN